MRRVYLAEKKETLRALSELAKDEKGRQLMKAAAAMGAECRVVLEATQNGRRATVYSGSGRALGQVRYNKALWLRGEMKET